MKQISSKQSKPHRGDELKELTEIKRSFNIMLKK
jgi:hypothetical protein